MAVIENAIKKKERDYISERRYKTDVLNKEKKRACVSVSIIIEKKKNDHDKSSDR
jgi:hypothetical protein